MAEDPRRQATTWSVYILRCRDGTYYTGIARDVQERLRKHQAGKGAAYTRTRLPVELLYEENDLPRSEALVREARIKAMPREKKGQLALTPKRVRGGAGKGPRLEMNADPGAEPGERSLYGPHGGESMSNSTDSEETPTLGSHLTDKPKTPDWLEALNSFLDRTYLQADRETGC